MNDHNNAHEPVFQRQLDTLALAPDEGMTTGVVGAIALVPTPTFMVARGPARTGGIGGAFTGVLDHAANAERRNDDDRHDSERNGKHTIHRCPSLAGPRARSTPRRHTWVTHGTRVPTEQRVTRPPDPKSRPFRSFYRQGVRSQRVHKSRRERALSLCSGRSSVVVANKPARRSCTKTGKPCRPNKPQ